MDLSTRLSILLGGAVLAWLCTFNTIEPKTAEVSAWIQGTPAVIQDWSELGQGFDEAEGTRFVYVIDTHHG